MLTPGTPRTRLICELGAPLWTEERDGATVDIFSFKQGYTKAVKAGRALVHGAADVATGGLWEVVGIPAESLADGKDVKVEVTYDDRRAVRSVDVIEGQDVISPRRRFGRRRKADSKPAVVESPAVEPSTAGPAERAEDPAVAEHNLGASHGLLKARHSTVLRTSQPIAPLVSSLPLRVTWAELRRAISESGAPRGCTAGLPSSAALEGSAAVLTAGQTSSATQHRTIELLGTLKPLTASRRATDATRP